MSKYTHFIIFSYSLSCLQFLHSMNIDQPYILDKLDSYCFVCNQDKIFYFCWIPRYIDIHGKNEADKAAKSALDIENILSLIFPLQTLNI